MSKFWTPTFPPPSPLHFPLYSQTYNFGLSTPHSWTSLIGIQNSPTLDNFGIYLENLNNEINMVMHSFFFANAQSIYYSHMYNKTDRKANSFSLIRPL